MLEKIKRQIAKLLALGIDQAGKPEGELAMEKAEKLIAEHNLSKSDFDEKGDEIKDNEIPVPAATWRRAILRCSGMVAGTFTFIKSGKRACVIVGKDHLVEVTKYLFDSLQVQCEKDTRAWVRRCQSQGWNPDRSQRFDYRSSWTVGLREKVQTIMDAREAARKAAEAEGQTTSIALSSERKLAEIWARRHWRLRGTSASSFDINPGAVKAGHRANFNPGIGSGGGRKGGRFLGS